MYRYVPVHTLVLNPVLLFRVCDFRSHWGSSESGILSDRDSLVTTLSISKSRFHFSFSESIILNILFLILYCLHYFSFRFFFVVFHFIIFHYFYSKKMYHYFHYSLLIIFIIFFRFKNIHYINYLSLESLFFSWIIFMICSCIDLFQLFYFHTIMFHYLSLFLPSLYSLDLNILNEINYSISCSLFIVIFFVFTFNYFHYFHYLWWWLK